MKLYGAFGAVKSCATEGRAGSSRWQTDASRNLSYLDDQHRGENDAKRNASDLHALHQFDRETDNRTRAEHDVVNQFDPRRIGLSAADARRANAPSSGGRKAGGAARNGTRRVDFRELVRRSSPVPLIHGPEHERQAGALSSRGASHTVWVTVDGCDFERRR